MIIHISYKRMMQAAVAALLLILVWLSIVYFAWVKVYVNAPSDKLVFTVKFLLPMLQDKTIDRFTITSTLPGRKVNYKTEWLSLNTVKVIVDDGKSPRGLEYRYSFKNAPALLPLFRVSASGKVLRKVKPELLPEFPKYNVPTAGPVTIKFNTFINPNSFATSVNWAGGGKFKPVVRESSDGSFTDYSEWILVPGKKLQNDCAYKIEIKNNLTAQNGLKLGENINLSFNTAPAFRLSEIYPQPDSSTVWLGRCISITANQNLKDARITVEGVKGNTEIKENSVMFIPERIFRSDTDYCVEAVLTSEYGEKISQKYSFHTVNLGRQKWLEIKLGKACTVWEMAGDSEIENFSAWMEREPPRGTIYEVDRGTAGGAEMCWIRLNADVLIHSLPEGNDDNHQKLGLPETHSCIYMNKNDVKRLCEDLPKGFMIIVY